MLRPYFRYTLRRPPALSSSFLHNPRPLLTHNRLISTAPPQGPRSWKSLFVRVGLAAGAIYYYNTSKLFAEEPLYAIPPYPPAASQEDEATLPRLNSLTTPRQATAPAPTLASQPYIDPNTSSTTSSTAPQTTSASSPNPLSPQQTSPSVSSPLDETEEEASQQGAFNEETGEINWDCPCLGGMAHGSCGEQFRAAFSCFVFSKEEPKGMDCIENFKTMQGCFREHPEEYGAELEDEEDDNEGGQNRLEEGPHAGNGEAQTYANGEPLPEPARKGVQAAEDQTSLPLSSSSPATSAAATTSPSSAPASSSPSSPSGTHATQRAKAAKAQVAKEHSEPVSESDELVPKAAHDARDAGQS